MGSGSSEEVLMVAAANLLPSNDSASLPRIGNTVELIIGCTYKFKVF